MSYQEESNYIKDRVFDATKYRSREHQERQIKIEAANKEIKEFHEDIPESIGEYEAQIIAIEFDDCCYTNVDGDAAREIAREADKENKELKRKIAFLEDTMVRIMVSPKMG